MYEKRNIFSVVLLTKLTDVRSNGSYGKAERGRVVVPEK